MTKTKDGKIRLSPSALNVFLECQRCFWLEYRKGLSRPRGPFPSLPGGMDILIKKYFDKYRAVGKLPPELHGQVTGELLADVEVLKKWRSWRSGLSYYDKQSDAILVGALDDCLVDKGMYIPIDYKTRGFDVTDGGENFYRNQLNCYCFLLEANQFPQPNFAYLIYYIPKEIGDQSMVKFATTLKKVETKAEDALKVFKAAVAVLQGPMPVSHSECHFCLWGSDFVGATPSSEA